MRVSAAPSVPATYIRGGTSKAIFFHEKDLPPPGPARDEFLIRIMGSPDAGQIDGMGGTQINTSKVAIIKPSERPGVDVDYTFAQVSITEARVTYDANCGNISAGVGPFAINEGLLDESNEGEDKSTRRVRIYNTGSQKILIAHVPIDGSTGRALEKGDYKISGCPSPGAPILMDYSQVANTQPWDVVLPTENVTDVVQCGDQQVSVTLCDVANPIMFVSAQSLGINGDERAKSLDADSDLLARVKEVRGRVAQLIGKCNDWRLVDEQSPMLPMIALVSKSTSAEGHIQSRLYVDNRCHPSMAGTGAVCTAACSRVEGSVVHSLLEPTALDSDIFQIQHPLGHLPIQVKATKREGAQSLPLFELLAFVRTARYLFQGQLMIPADLENPWRDSHQTNGSHPDIRPNGTAHSTSSEAAKLENGEHASEQGITAQFAAFIQDARLEDLESHTMQALKQYFLDFLGVATLGATSPESSRPFLESVKTLTNGSSADTMVFGTTQRFPPQYAALLNGSYAHSLDFDDTYSDGSLHPGAPVIAAALAEVQGKPNINFQDMLLAIAAGYEVSCRLGAALGTGSYERGFHNTSVAGIFGAVATLSKLRGLQTPMIENALGLAVSYASGSQQYLENGAWNKRLHAGTAAHNAFLCVALAQAGVLGAAKPIEGKFGLIAAHTPHPNMDGLVRGLGETWDFEKTALKPYPACRMTHTHIELAAELSASRSSQPVDKIHISIDKACYPVVGVPIANKTHPKNVVDAQFSVYYQTAASWLYGSSQGWAIYDHLNDPAVHSLCDRITIEPKEMSQVLETTLTATWQDGVIQERSLYEPLWEANRPPSQAGVEKKFASLAEGVIGEKKTKRIIEWVSTAESEPVAALLSLLM